MDFLALPPEINSGLMYTGPGSGPMLAAALAWDDLAAELYSTASSYSSAVSALTSAWQGPSSASMVAAATPYVAWISSTAGQAEATGAQAKAAVAAYEAAFAMTVPPPVITANRALLMLLIATNFFGQNTPAIMATEAQYMEMWAQDAAAMSGYQAGAQAATVFTSFTVPAQTTNEGGGAAQAMSVGQAAGTGAGTAAQTVAPLASAASTPMSMGSAMSATPLSTGAVASTATTTTTSTSTLSSVSALTSSSSALTSGTSSATGLASGAGSSASMGTTGVSMLSSMNSIMNAVNPAANALTNQFQFFGSALGGVSPGTSIIGSAGMGNAAATAGVGRAASLGVLSVPQNWTTAAPAFSQFSQVSSILPTTGANAVPAVSAANPGMVPPPLSTLFGRESTPMVSTARFDVRPTVVQRPVAAG